MGVCTGVGFGVAFATGVLFVIRRFSKQMVAPSLSMICNEISELRAGMVAFPTDRAPLSVGDDRDSPPSTGAPEEEPDDALQPEEESDDALQPRSLGGRHPSIPQSARLSAEELREEAMRDLKAFTREHAPAPKPTARRVRLQSGLARKASKLVSGAKAPGGKQRGRGHAAMEPASLSDDGRRAMRE